MDAHEKAAADGEVLAALGDVSDELYGVLPEEFTARRNARAKQARDAGDRKLAEAIRALRKPTVSAWLANLLVRERADDVRQLLDLGAALREAQDTLSRDDLQQLSRQRHEVVASLARAARRLGSEAGQPVTEHVQRELEGTLEAALADPQAAAALMSGRLTGALSYSGLGPVDVEGAVATPLPARRVEGEPGKQGSPAEAGRGGARQQRQALEAAQRAADDARAAAQSAHREAEAQQRRAAETRARRDDRHQRIGELQAQLDALRAEEAAAAEALREAERAQVSADRAARSAEREADRAEQRLEQVRARASG